MIPWINSEALIEAFRQKWVKEHPVYEDTSGSMTYSEIIDFIRGYVKRVSQINDCDDHIE